MELTELNLVDVKADVTLGQNRAGQEVIAEVCRFDEAASDTELKKLLQW